jgi:hypothetical protein
MSRRKPLAAAVALASALALAAPAASSARTTHAFPLPPISVGGPFQPGSPPCWLLVRQAQFALATGNIAWANAISTVFIYAGCGGAAT